MKKNKKQNMTCVEALYFVSGIFLAWSLVCIFCFFESAIVGVVSWCALLLSLLFTIMYSYAVRKINFEKSTQINKDDQKGKEN